MNIEKIPFRAFIGKEPYIFVSYAHLDYERVFAILNSLNESRYRIWYDEGIDPGNEWREEVAEALEKNSCFLLFVSKNSMSSDNVRNEICYTVDSDKDICRICVYLEETDIPPSVKFIQSFKSVNIFSGNNTDELMELLDDKLITDDEYTSGPAKFYPDDMEWILNRMSYDDAVKKIKEGLDGKEAEKNMAFSLANELAFSGFPEQQMLTAMMYIKGIGIPLNTLHAQKWIKLASISGHREAAEIVKNNYETDDAIINKYLKL